MMVAAMIRRLFSFFSGKTLHCLPVHQFNAKQCNCASEINVSGGSCHWQEELSRALNSVEASPKISTRRAESSW
jgi:hypothetical protein